MPCLEPGYQKHLPAQIGFIREQSTATLEQQTPKLRRLNTPGIPVEQPYSQGPFQRRDASRHRWLRDMQRTCSAREISVTRQCNGMPHEPEVDHDTPIVSEQSRACIGRMTAAGLTMGWSQHAGRRP
jgi:hypothetical protein